MWVDGNWTERKPIKCGVNSDKGVEERIRGFIFSVITHRARVKKKKKMRRDIKENQVEPTV